jgi:hypothetical protein
LLFCTSPRKEKNTNKRNNCEEERKDDRIIASWLWDGKLFIRATVQQGAAAQLYSKKEESLLLSHGKRCQPATHVLIF